MQATAGPDINIGPLPQDAKHAAAVTPVPGADYDAAGAGVAVVDTAVVLDGAGVDYTWARYAFALPMGHVLYSVTTAVQDVSNVYWVAFSNYHKGRWEWHGPYIDTATPEFNGDETDYISPGGVFYWVVVAQRDHSLRLNETLIDEARPPIAPPSRDNHLIVAGGCLSPSLEHMPEIAGAAIAGAPVIAYIHLEGDAPKLYLAYYSAGNWRQQPVQADHDFALPQIRWLGSQGIIVVYDYTAGALMDMRFNELLEITGTTQIMESTGPGISGISLDVGGGGELGLAHAYTNEASGQLFYSTYDGTNWQNSADMHEGDPVRGLVFRYDPLGGDPWLIYTHGMVDTTETVNMDFYMEEGRLVGGAWEFNPIPYDDSPYIVDLEFLADGTPQLCFVAARDYVVGWPINLSATILFDTVVAEYNGGEWDASVLYRASITPHYTFPNQTADFDVAISPEAHWAAPNEIYYVTASGTVTVDLISQTPTDGSLSPTGVYMINEGSGFRLDERINAPGHSFCWDLGDDGTGAAAFISASEITADDVFGGSLAAASDLRYWSWFYASPT